MQRLTSLLSTLARRNDVALALLLLIVIFMIILPLPTWLLDLMIAVNLMISIFLLMAALYIREPLEFSAFPSLLLLTTLYRLSITISSTRLILLQADAGEIITTFGNFAAGGNLGVGFIVFIIITVVQFIVVTKGSERVAEVSARFSLDGMPGKQMSIDSDMRAGTIDATEARRLRALIQKESQLYGAMDGAMKFVKGDAIAGIIIIIVNILGGTAVGIFMHNMSASEALSTYAILSIGDGLVGQIPALLIAITAGIIVTRIPGETRQNLANEFAEQLSTQPQALMLAGSVLLVFAIIPGFPLLYFALLAGILFTLAWYILKRAKTDNGPSAQNRWSATSLPTEEAQKSVMTPGAVPLIIRFAHPTFRPNRLQEHIDKLRYQVFETMGLPLPEIQIQPLQSPQPAMVEIFLYQELVLSARLPEESCLVDAYTRATLTSDQRDELPFGQLALLWMPASQADTLQAMGTPVYQDEACLSHCAFIVIKHFARYFVGVQETRFLMDAMEIRYPELIKETQRQLPISRIADILQRLTEENISIRDLRTIFEALNEWAPREKDPVMLAEYVRIALRRHITLKHRDAQASLNCWMIGDSIESRVRESVRQTAVGSYSSLTPDETAAILSEIQSAVATHSLPNAVLITAVDVRRFIKKMIERELSHLAVLSFQEISDEVELRVLATLEIKGSLDHASAG
ncbi:EscV/YscV/HrcV family type III secretion system export apparatus protein [Enterobacterales bacterium CwR94]|nr:EscV/YscV/HrcV family type III secretion system export apparatus protein [Enterobacterales bacterium CwR94]